MPIDEAGSVPLWVSKKVSQLRRNNELNDRLSGVCNVHTAMFYIMDVANLKFSGSSFIDHWGRSGQVLYFQPYMDQATVKDKAEWLAELLGCNWRFTETRYESRLPTTRVEFYLDFDENFDKDKELLELGAWFHFTAIHEHIDVNQPIDVDAYNYITAQLSYVENNAAEVVDFLRRAGVKSIDRKHLQYFLAFDHPVYEPYMKLWGFCFNRMDDFNILPTNAKSTFSRLLSADKRDRPFLNRKPA